MTCIIFAILLRLALPPLSHSDKRLGCIPASPSTLRCVCLGLLCSRGSVVKSALVVAPLTQKAKFLRGKGWGASLGTWFAVRSDSCTSNQCHLLRFYLLALSFWSISPSSKSLTANSLCARSASVPPALMPRLVSSAFKLSRVQLLSRSAGRATRCSGIGELGAGAGAGAGTDVRA